MRASIGSRQHASSVCCPTRGRNVVVRAGSEPARRDVLVGAPLAAAAVLILNPLALPAARADVEAAPAVAAPPPPPPTPPPPDPPTTHTAFLDLAVGGKPAGRININLFGEATPKTVANFLALAGAPIEGVGKKSKLVGRFKGSIFHRLVKGFVLQGGDFTRGNGTGGESIYGWTFPDEAFLPHGGAGAISMANRGPNSGGSQFFVTLAPTPWLDGKHVVFGRVDAAGVDLVASIVAREEVDFFSKPRLPVTIVGCGLVEGEGAAGAGAVGGA